MPGAPGSNRISAGRCAPSGGDCCGVSWRGSCFWFWSATSSCSRRRCGSSTASSRAGSTSPRTSRYPRRRARLPRGFPLAREPDLFGVGKHVLEDTRLPARLLARPERRVEQVAVVLVEDLARPGVGDEKALELLGDHVALADAPVGLGGELFLVARCRRDALEGDLGDRLDLVVVVEHHAVVARDAEVLEQHVARKDAGAGELLDRIPIITQRGAQFRLVAVAPAFLDVDVERLHAPLDVDVAEDELVAVELHGG